MNSKDISSNKQGSAADNKVSNKNVSNKNVTPTENRSKTPPKSGYNDPFHTPPGEGPKPRITSN